MADIIFEAIHEIHIDNAFLNPERIDVFVVLHVEVNSAYTILGGFISRKKGGECK